MSIFWCQYQEHESVEIKHFGGLQRNQIQIKPAERTNNVRYCNFSHHQRIFLQERNAVVYTTRNCHHIQHNLTRYGSLCSTDSFRHNLAIALYLLGQSERCSSKLINYHPYYYYKVVGTKVLLHVLFPKGNKANTGNADCGVVDFVSHSHYTHVPYIQM